MKLNRLALLATLVSVLGFASGCAPDPVGAKCFIGDVGDVDPSQAIVSSPALECASRTCLRYPQEPGSELPEAGEWADLCTGFCDGDGDCVREDNSVCLGGFECAIPVVVGPFACRKMCICKDYLEALPEGVERSTPEPCLAR